MMVLRDMLSQNPNHSAVFLVDKILLGFQQYQVIKKQIGEKYFRRLVRLSRRCFDLFKEWTVGFEILWSELDDVL